MASFAAVRAGRNVTADDIDLWRAAKLLMDRYGDDATIEAMKRADVLAAKGNTEGEAERYPARALVDSVMVVPSCGYRQMFRHCMPELLNRVCLFRKGFCINPKIIWPRNANRCW